MTRRFLDDVRADIVTRFPDNILGEIEPIDVRETLTDLLDSAVQDEGGIAATAPTVGIATSAVPLELINIYDVNVGGDGVFVKPDFTLGRVQTGAEAGFSYNIVGGISFEGSNNTRYDFQTFLNGQPFGFVTAETGQGNNDPVSFTVRTGVVAAGSNDVWTLAVTSPDGNSSIDILDAYLFAIILPTNNP